MLEKYTFVSSKYLKSYFLIFSWKIVHLYFKQRCQTPKIQIMGITIHYRGKLNDIKQIYKIKDELIDIAKSMGWEWDSLDEDWNKPNTAKLIHQKNRAEIKGHLPLKGISFVPHPDSDTVSFYFDGTGKLQTPIGMVLINEGKIEHDGCVSVKTQFAPPEVHITIVKLLKYLKKKYISNLIVRDEGEYWETGDENILREKIDFLAQKINLLRSEISKLSPNEMGKTPEDMVRTIVNILNKKQREGTK